MKDREYQCIHYTYEGCCDLGKEGTFRDKCQTCASYRKKPGGKPARTDNRRQKEERRFRKEKYEY